jgi:DNA mismatch repair protein MutS2
MLEVSSSTLDALEFPQLLRLLAELTATDVGRERALALRPAADLDQLNERRARFEEVRLLLVDGSLVAGLEGDLEPLLERLEDPRGALDSVDVLQAVDLLRMAQGVVARVRRTADPACPHLAPLVAELPDSRDWIERVGRILDPRGQIREDASPALAKLRRRVRQLRQDLYQDLQRSVDLHGSHLSEETIPLHEGRLVLMLKSGARGQIDGLIHGRSASGKSYYFEPLDVVEGNNRLRTTIDDESAERARLIAELIEGLRQRAETVGLAARLIAELDLLQAAARLAELSAGRLPELAGRDELRLCAARHPLLDPAFADLRQRALGSAGHRDAMVPLDLELSEDCRLLVITGPNAGGKTVALKTAGLLTLASLCGLPVPCATGTRIPLLERLVATVGDEQDLLNERSTFSARLLRLREAWEAAAPGALVLLDELGSGTDPDEGTALASALLEHLLDNRALTVVTTHLTRLAALALEAEGAACAAMEFDSGAERPTYRLLPGTPGASEALALARRLHLPAEWLARASEALDPQQRQLQQLLTEVERTRRDLAGKLALVARQEGALEASRAAAEAEADALVAERRKVAHRLKSQLTDFERRVRGRLREAETQMLDELKKGRRRGVAAAAAESLLREAPEAIARIDEPTATDGPLIVGGDVRHRGLGWRGRLDKLDRGRAVVDVRGKRMRCAEEDLVGVAASRPGEGRPGPVVAGAAVARPQSAPVAAELKLLGLRVEEALIELDRYLDQALLAGSTEVRIVHGHGTGRLREAVREHLGPHLAVAAYRPGGEGEGGDGATVVELRS